jgi:uncharacterized protein YybS (DUF2232 family)
MNADQIISLLIYIAGIPMCIRMCLLHNKLLREAAPRLAFIIAALLWPLLAVCMAVGGLYDFLTERRT